jgi:hypothetical protein
MLRKLSEYRRVAVEGASGLVEKNLALTVDQRQLVEPPAEVSFERHEIADLGELVEMQTIAGEAQLPRGHPLQDLPAG